MDPRAHEERARASVPLERRRSARAVLVPTAAAAAAAAPMAFLQAQYNGGGRWLLLKQ